MRHTATLIDEWNNAHPHHDGHLHERVQYADAAAPGGVRRCNTISYAFDLGGFAAVWVDGSPSPVLLESLTIVHAVAQG
jgi:hypothetical protein